MANSAALRRAKENLYSNLVKHVINAVAPFLGQALTPALLKILFSKTKPLIDQGRLKAQSIAYQDYLKFIDGKDPIPKIPLRRFSDELWQGSLEKITKDEEVFSTEIATKLGMKADLWARDAEWGQRAASAKMDDRIWRAARVDFDPPSCPWCTLLNSRGPVYISAESGSRTLHDGDTCTLIFVAKGDTGYPGHEVTAKALASYNEARKRAGADPSTDDILREMKQPGSSQNKPGRVKSNAQDSAANASASKLKDAQARVRTLEAMSPKSDSAKAYQQAQLAKNRKLVQSLSPEGSK